MRSTHLFRFGTACTATNREELIEQARQAEDLGYSTLLFEDHLSKTLSPIPAMLAAAEATSTLRVGSYVFGNDFRHPVQLARETATVDLLTGGRLEVGIGAGWKAADYHQSGLTLGHDHVGDAQPCAGDAGTPAPHGRGLRDQINIQDGLHCAPSFLSSLYLTCNHVFTSEQSIQSKIRLTGCHHITTGSKAQLNCIDQIPSIR